MKHSLLLIFFLLCFGNMHPQERDSVNRTKEVQYDTTSELKPIEFDRKKIEDYKGDKEFSYLDTSEKDNWWTRFKKWLSSKYNQFIHWLFGSYEPGSILEFLIKSLPYILLLIFLGLVIWLFARLNPGGQLLQKPKLSEVILTEEEELVKNQDLPSLIRKAVLEKNYRLAVRYYYLKELRNLDKLQLIDYEFQKTNKDYFEEIENTGIRHQFFEITKLYEFIWYGNFQVTERDYRLAEKGFLKMEKVLNIPEHE